MSSIFWERFYSVCEQNGTRPNPVAKEINISSGILTKWKTLGTLPNGETLIKLADYFDCSVDYLLGRTDVVEVNRGVKIIVDDGNTVTPYMAAYDGSTPDNAKMSLKTIKQLDDEN